MQRNARLVLWFVAIFILGVATRIYLEKYTYIFGFDSYWFARMSSYVIRHGSVPKYDPIAWRGSPPIQINWELSMYYPAWVYRLFHGAVYDRLNLLNVFKWLPAIFGALGSVFTGLAVLIVAGPVAGVLAGIFAATNPGYIYRTMSGFYEDDATSFFIPLGIIFAFLAYRARDWKRFWVFTALAGASWLLQAISWEGFYIVPYTSAIFLAMFVGYVVLSYLSKYLRVPADEFVVPLLSGALAVITSLALRFIALREIGDAIYLAGAYTSTSVFTIAATSFPYIFSAFFFGMFAAYVVYFLSRGDRKYVYFALGSLVLALLPLFSLASTGYSTRVMLPNGYERSVGFNPTHPGRVLLGAGLVILLAQLAGAFGTLLSLGRRDEKPADMRLLAVIFVPLLFSAFSGAINGYDWYSPVVTTVSNILMPPESVSTDGNVLVKPYTGLVEPKTSGPFSAVIGEETYGFLNWPAKYGILFILAIFSIPFLFYRSLKDKRFLFLLAWVALGWYASWYKLKFAYYFGMPIAVAGAVFLNEIYERVKGKWSTVSFFAITGIIVFSMVSTGLYHTVTRIPTLLTSAEAAEMRMFGAESADEYLEMFQWIDANTPPDANLLNWWDIGHWLTFFTERGVMTDNTNARLSADINAARFYLSDENTAYQIARAYGMNYVIYDMDFLFKSSALALYALGIVPLNDPRLNDYAAGTVSCKQVTSPLTGEPVYWCGSGVGYFDQNTWSQIPLFAAPFYRDSEHAFKREYRDQSGDVREFVIYRLGTGPNTGIILMTPQVNDSMIMKMALGVPMEHFERVWASESGRLQIYKIK